MTDINVLTTIIQGDPRYDTAVQDGNNGVLRDLLNADNNAAPKRWRSCRVEDFLEAVQAETLTTQELTQIQTYASSGGSIPTHRAGARAWVEGKFMSNGGTWTAATEAAVRMLVERPSPYCVAALADAEDKVSLRDVRQAVRQVVGWWGADAQKNARNAEKAARAVVEMARRNRIKAELDAEGYPGIRGDVRQQFSSAERRIQAELLLRVREDRINDGTWVPSV